MANWFTDEAGTVQSEDGDRIERGTSKGEGEESAKGEQRCRQRASESLSLHETHLSGVVKSLWDVWQVLDGSLYIHYCFLRFYVIVSKSTVHDHEQARIRKSDTGSSSHIFELRTT